MREIIAEDQPFVRHEHAIDEGLALFADQPFKREIIEAVRSRCRRGRRRAGRRRRRGRSVSTYRERAEHFTDLCRGPHVPSTGRLGPLQADAGGRRLLAGRREAAAAPAHLRHGLGVREGPGRAPAPARGGRAARPPQARGRARPVLVPRRDRLGPGRLPSQGRHHPPAHGGLLAAAPRGRPATSSSTRPHITKADLFEISGHLEWFAEGMYPPMELDGGHRVLPQADELPLPHPHLPEPAALLPRAPHAAVRVRHASTATRSPAWSTGSPGCGA